MKYLWGMFVFVLAFCAGAVEYKFELKSNKADIIKVGEEVTFSARLLSRADAKAGFAPAKTGTLLCLLVGDGNKTVTQKAAVNDKFVTISGKLSRPGWIYARFILLDEKGKAVTFKNSKGRDQLIHAGIGALVEPDKLKPGQAEPKDFDAFWKSQRERLNKVPLNAKVTEVPSKAPKGFKLYDVKVDCAGSAPVSGYLTVPVNAKPKSLPAYMLYHGAGVRSSAPSCAPGAITMNVNAHGIPNGQNRDFYVKLGQTTLKSYAFQNKEDREKIYFNGMYLRIMRSLDYIKTRPEWDGKTIIVYGGSQGGGQSIAAAALDPQVTLCVAGVAALSDHAGSLAGRQPGWPRFYDVRNGRKVDPRVVAATAYYDNVFFARRIKCEVWLTAGLFDTTCSPAGIYLVYNNLAAANKHIDLFATGNHGGAPCLNGQKRIRELLNAKK